MSILDFFQLGAGFFPLGHDLVEFTADLGMLVVDIHILAGSGGQFVLDVGESLLQFADFCFAGLYLFLGLAYAALAVLLLLLVKFGLTGRGLGCIGLAGRYRGRILDFELL